MATITPNLTTFSLADDNTGGTWVGTSGAFDNQVNYQGTNCWYYQTPKNGIGDGNFTPTAAVDMSATDVHLYWWMRCDVFQFCELLNTGATSSGLMVKIESSASDYVTWHLAGSDTWGGEWKAFVLDVNNTANKFATVGTLNLSAVTKISFLTDNSNSGTIRIVDNTMLDAVRFGTGITTTGLDFDLTDIALEDALPANKWGILRIDDDNIHCQGRITNGNGATVTTFNSTDEEIVFSDALVSSTLYEFNIVGSGNTSVLKGFSIKASGNARFKFDASDATADITMSGSAMKKGASVLFASTSDIQTTVFNNCLQIEPSTGIFKFNSISNYVGTTGALLFPSDSANISDITFSICDNDVEYASGSDATPAFVSFVHDDNAGDFDVNNTSGGAITIVLSGTSNANSSTGSAVTFSNPKSFKFTLNPSIINYEWRIYSVTALGSLAGSIELDGEEEAIVDNQTYNYTYSIDTPMAVQILTQPEDEYREEIQYFTLKNSNQDVVINLSIDTNI